MPAAAKKPVKKTAAKKPVKKTTTKKKPAAKSTGHDYKHYFPLELARLKKKHNYVTGSSNNKVEWSVIFSEAAASAKKLAK